MSTIHSCLIITSPSHVTVHRMTVRFRTTTDSNEYAEHALTSNQLEVKIYILEVTAAQHVCLMPCTGRVFEN